jgi:hypothetical protein
LILYNKDFERNTSHGYQKIKPKPIDLDWEKECYMNLNIKQKLKATRGNLMNLLDLAKSNRADN